MDAHERLTIGVVASQLGIGTETIRYYHRIGLLPVPPVPPGRAQRVYAREQVVLLGFIRRAQRLGFSLEEIRDLIKLSNGTECGSVQVLAARKLGELDQKLAEIALMRDTIARLLGACAHNGDDNSCPLTDVLCRDSVPCNGKACGAAASGPS
jgi:MerR family transcriptional regulator, mercuric resistance operon regulatory protein